MTSFSEWWEAEEVFMRAEGADDEIILGAMRSIAEMAWDAALEAVAISAGASCEQQLRSQWQPIKAAPKDGTEVLVRSRHGVRFLAQWIGRYQEEAAETELGPLDTDWADYCDKRGEYYLPEGWYRTEDCPSCLVFHELSGDDVPTEWARIPE